MLLELIHGAGEEEVLLSVELDCDAAGDEAAARYAEKRSVENEFANIVAYGECHCAGVESCCTLLVVEAAARPLLSLVADYG
ncbi:hypothetical protein OIU77_027207 [Salix suchowensis]|uniref:Uncharacterized protein n=2 Tax=Salix TaxID=40685 RepID=A0A9Q0PWA4_9ROSI|nr:hypothetical protein OIU78_013883 [Salix suchowensis]KAJ6388804.1 hypothetical protein OIU77_027207 [Salix suchowensis]KAJ6695590.1 hypothetical protein OIU74_014660 [Salix koriyanagi]